MKNLKNQTGITLVALVVTIIVLLILAGVSLNLVAGSDGILSKASGAVDKNQIATVQESADLALAEAKADYLEAKYADRDLADGQETFPAYLAANLSSYKVVGGSIAVDATSKKVTLTIDKMTEKYEITLTDEGSVSGTWTTVTGE